MRDLRGIDVTGIVDRIASQFLFTFALMGDLMLKTRVPLLLPLALLALVYVWPFALFLIFCAWASVGKTEWLERYRR
ncbi:MAG: hypothetical protein HY556_02065 [Euryarchaeota archaeon]|nr:hypothetical protein [Euryarchaeota archaeon]